jgi:hypothetical protein
MKNPTIITALLLASTLLIQAQTTAALKTTSPGVYGDLKKWHRVTIAFEVPECSENGDPNPFLDFRLEVIFRHHASANMLTAPGYFAADGFAGETGADSGKIWRVHFSPPETGEWSYQAFFSTGKNVSVAPKRAEGRF